jgi:hypothetical protein
MMKKGGATPCDRRLDRRKVAIAAAAALFLFATEVRANVVDFVLVQSSSWLIQNSKIFGPGIGIHNSIPQYGLPTPLVSGPFPNGQPPTGSDSTTYYGHIYVDINPTTIQLMPGSSMRAAIGWPGDGGSPGRYQPHDPVYSDPSFVNPGFNDNSNYGLSIPTLGVKSVQYGIRLDNGNVYAPSTTMGRAGNNFNLAGQGIGFTLGRQAFVSGLGNDTSSLIGDPMAFYGTNGSDIGTWDGTTLTIPVHSQFTFNVTTDFGGIDQTLFITGQLVAIPYVPEPSTFTLVGFGIVGLLSYAWRARKRNSLAA